MAALWVTFRVPLGERTLAGHLDRIAATPEAEDLIGGARQSLAPIMTEASRRVLGEYVEAPTFATTHHEERPERPEQADRTARRQHTARPTSAARHEGPARSEPTKPGAEAPAPEKRPSPSGTAPRDPPIFDARRFAPDPAILRRSSTRGRNSLGAGRTTWPEADAPALPGS